MTELLAMSDRWFSNTGLPEDLIREIQRINTKPFSGDVFTVGTYGKVGVTKGAFDLVDALKRISATGAQFAFLTLSCGRREVLQKYYETIVGCRALAKRTWILPPIAPWRIPSFLHRCDAICFLERNFPILFHGPLIPREVLSSGACLVCSGEIAKKPIYGGNLVDNRNAAIVADPKDRPALAGRLRSLISDPDRTQALARQGQKLARFWDENLDDFDAATRIFAREVEHLIALNKQGS